MSLLHQPIEIEKYSFVDAAWNKVSYIGFSLLVGLSICPSNYDP